MAIILTFSVATNVAATIAIVFFVYGIYFVASIIIAAVQYNAQWDVERAPNIGDPNPLNSSYLAAAPPVEQPPPSYSVLRNL
jgi:hypothetical protein